MLPSTVSGGQFPRLRTLHLLRSTLDWGNAVFVSNLSELSICYDRDRTSAQDAYNIITCLRSMPKLKSLSWKVKNDSTSALDIAQDPSHISPFGLPHLATMEIQAHVQVLLKVLSVVPHPKYQLKVTSTLPTMNHVRDVLRHAASFRHSVTQQGYELNATIFGSTWMSYGSTNIQMCNSSYQSATTALELQLYILDRTSREAVGEVLATELIADAQSLMVFSPSALRQFMPYLPQCATLCVCSSRFYETGHLFNDDSFFSSDGTRLMPALKRIILYEMDLGQLPKTSRKPERFTLPRFIRGIEVLVPIVLHLRIVDCKVPSSEDKKLEKLSLRFETFSCATTRIWQAWGSTCRSHAEVLLVLLNLP